MKKWEYKVLTWTELKANGYLNGLGEQGWELVAIREEGKRIPGLNGNLKYYFKREKQENEVQ